MSVHFLASALDRWDDADAGALVLTFFADERPLRGAAGLADWRLCGRLSRLIKRGKIQGQQGETLLMPPGQRLRFPRILLFGLGASDSFDETRFREHVRWIRGVLGRAGVSSYAIQPPGRATGLIAARRALELWIEEAGKDARHEEDVAIIDAPGAQKEMAEILRKAQKRGAPPRPGKDAAASGDDSPAASPGVKQGEAKEPDKRSDKGGKGSKGSNDAKGRSLGSMAPETMPETTIESEQRARHGGRRALAAAAGARAGTVDDAWD